MEEKEIILKVRWIGVSTILTNKKGDTFEIPGSSRYEELEDFITRALANSNQEHSASNIQAVSRCEGDERKPLLLAYHEFYLKYRKQISDSSPHYVVDAFLSKQ